MRSLAGKPRDGLEEQYTADLPSPIRGSTPPMYVGASPTQSFHSLSSPSASCSSSCSSPTAFSSIGSGCTKSMSSGYVSPENTPPSSPTTHKRGESGVLVFHPGHSDPCFGSLPGHNRALSRPDTGLASPPSSLPPVLTSTPPPILSLPPVPLLSNVANSVVHTMSQDAPASPISISVNALSLESCPIAQTHSTSVNHPTNAALPAIAEVPIATPRRTSLIKSFKDMCTVLFLLLLITNRF